MYPKLILRNVFRNLQTYTIYFFSLTLIYSLLYAFNALPSHPVMQSLSGAKEMLTTVMSQYMGLLSYLILSAIAFLIVYATNFVLGRRKKELGLYATLGMKKKQIIRTLFFETMLVNIFSLILGFLLGLILLVILAKIASEFFMANYFGNLVFFDSKSVILLVYSYLVTSFIVGVMDILTFRKQNIIALIQENGVKKSVLAKGKPVLQALLFILSTAVIGFGALYFSDYHHLSFLKSWGILLVSVFVIFVILFYNTLSHFILVSLRKLPQTYYNKLNTFKIRQFSKQADSNSVTLAVLSLTLTLALSLLVFSGSAYTTMNRELNKYSPYDVTKLYQTIANQGRRIELTTVDTIADRQGNIIYQHDKTAKQVVPQEAAFQTLFAMQQTVERGTARSLQNDYADLRLAGKTGTTNDARDTWFVGIDGKNISTVWLGRDDNGETKLTGASGALQIYKDYLSHTYIEKLKLNKPANMKWVGITQHGSWDCDSNRVIPVWVNNGQNFCGGTSNASPSPATPPAETEIPPRQESVWDVLDNPNPPAQ